MLGVSVIVGIGVSEGVTVMVGEGGKYSYATGSPNTGKTMARITNITAKSKQTPSGRDALPAQAKERHSARRLDIANSAPNANQRNDGQDRSDCNEARLNVHTRHYTSG